MKTNANLQEIQEIYSKSNYYVVMRYNKAVISSPCVIRKSSEMTE